jgi:hypothetical protein
MKNQLPKLRIIDKVADKYLFNYIVDNESLYTYIKPEGQKFIIKLGRLPQQVMIVDKDSEMGKDITLQIIKINDK